MKRDPQVEFVITKAVLLTFLDRVQICQFCMCIYIVNLTSALTPFCSDPS